MLTNIQPPPGFFSDITDLDAGEKWVRGDKVRFHLGRLRKLGGWARIDDATQMEGKCRFILPFQDLDLRKSIWLGTHQRVYLYNEGLVDITPLDEADTLTDPFTTQGIGTSTIIVTHVAHNRVEGDIVIIDDGPYITDGVTVADGEYIILSIVDADNYIIQGTGAAISGNTNGTATVTYEYLLSIGREYADFAGGWGSGAWGSGAWGSPRLGSNYVQPSIWSADNWGEDVIAVRRTRGRVYYFDTSAGLTGNRMEPIERLAADDLGPTGSYPLANLVTVSPERIMILFGAEVSFGGDFDPLMIRWSDRENYQVLDDLDTNLAGSFRLQSGNEILAAEKTRNGYVVLTDTSATFMQFVGFPFAFGFTPLGSNCGVMGPNASIEHNGVTYWMGANHNFYRFDGRLEVMTCPVQQTVANSLNDVQGHLVVAGVNAQWQEVWWLYPGTGGSENSRYVIYNWEENSWYTGTIVRTYFVDQGTFTHPIATDAEGYIYFHETGVNDYMSPMDAWAETGEFQLADGDRLIFMDTIIPDATINGTVDVTIKTRRYPMTNEEFNKGPYTITPVTEKIKMRARGRQWAVRIAANTLGDDFLLGKFRVNIQPDGGR